MKKIIVQRINSNEDIYTIGKHCVNEGDHIGVGDVIAEVESSKAIESIQSESSGYIHFLCEAGDNVNVMSAIAIVFETLKDYKEYISSKETNKTSNTRSYQLTKKAQLLVDEYSIRDEELERLGIKIIRTSDLEMLIKLRSPKNETKLSDNQKQVSRVVTESYNKIPQSFLLEKIDVTSCIHYLNRLYKDMGIQVGIVELLIMILFKLRPSFPTFFSMYNENGYLVSPIDIGVGITIDVGNGLFIPVIKEEDGASIETIAEKMYEYKKKATKGRFDSEDLKGACISISLNTIGDVVFSIPILFPTQMAMISIGTTIRELSLEDDRLVSRDYLYIGLAYDHRAINGFMAMNFVKGIAEQIREYK